MKTLKVLITNAASKTVCNLLPALCSDGVFGKNKIHLVLFAFKPLISDVEMLACDLLECSYPMLDGITTTMDMSKAFLDVDVAILFELERNVIGFKTNAVLFRSYGLTLNQLASKTVKVLICGRTASTSAFICSSFSPSVNPANFTCLAQHVKYAVESAIKSSCGKSHLVSHATTASLSSSPDQNLRTSTEVQPFQDEGDFSLDDIIVWGSCQNPVLSVKRKTDKKHLCLEDVIGHKVIPTHKPGALVTAKAIIDHLKIWLGAADDCHSACKRSRANSEEKYFCMGLVTKEQHYSVNKNLYFNYPIQQVLVVTPTDVEVSETVSIRLDLDPRLEKRLGEISDRLCNERDAAIVDCWRVVLPHSHL